MARRYDRYGRPYIEASLRLEEGLHARLKAKAAAARIGLATYIVLICNDHIESGKTIGVKTRRRVGA